MNVARARFLFGFAAGVLALTLVRGFFGGAWALRWDDGLWIGIARRWCDGARLYADVWESKGPLFFLWLRPICALRAPAPAIVTPAMLAVFWAPIFALYAVAGWRLAENVRTAPLFGVALSLLVWDNRTAELFATEKLAAGFVMLALAYRERALPALVAATLCNLRCALLFPLLFFWGRPRSRDVVLSCAIVGLVCLATMGLDRESYRWAWETATYASLYPGFSWAQLRREMVLGQPGVWTILLEPFQGWRDEWFRSAAYFKLAFCAVAAPTIWRTLRARPDLSVAILLTTIAVFRTGIVFGHTFVLFIPVVVLFAARAPGPALAVWCAMTFAIEMGRPERTIYADYARARGRAAPPLRGLADKPWIALLGNAYPVLALPGLRLPENRMFHAYCYAFPKWSEDQIRARITRGDVWVAVEGRFDRPGCAPREAVRWLRARCALTERSGSLELYECGHAGAETGAPPRNS